jgi:hypothetical protein
MPKIDDAEYQAGREWCAAGNNARSLVEKIGDGAAAEIATEEKRMSFFFGFIDELLDELRGIKGS